MTVQEQAFRAYYASLTDAELLKIAANRNSFITVAKQTLARELERRNLVPQEPPGASASETTPKASGAR